MFFLSNIRKIIFRFKEAGSLLLFPEKYDIYFKEKFAYHQLSFSQEGEDLMLLRLLEEKKKNGFYVDIGAHHPQRFSNTYFFYLKGWRGINVDPLPGSMKQFHAVRPFDVNIECAINNLKEELTYYQFNEPALNTFSKKIAKERNGLRDYRIIAKKKILCRRLDELLDMHLPEGQQIDFMSIDVEGLDLNVLRSNNWERYNPGIILVEDLQRQPLSEMENSPVVTYLVSKGYELYSKSVNTLFFVKMDG